MSEIHKNRYAAFNIDVHLVFITEYRKNVLDEVSHEYFSECMAGLCKHFDTE